ncbi:MAG TPA: DUF4145 domain-containing protein [Rhodanobacteraceae bacterium]
MDHAPAYDHQQFRCPHCGVLAQQTWFRRANASSAAGEILATTFYKFRSHVQSYEQNAAAKFMNEAQDSLLVNMGQFVPSDVSIATCGSCGKSTLWVGTALVYPRIPPIPPVNEDVCDEAKELYREAARILLDSPRGASALLRLALQLLLVQLGKSGNNINSDIRELVADGLSAKVQKAADLLRVVGNNAVHPGQIDLQDGSDVASKLFHLLNFIADEMITKPKELDALYVTVVPDSARTSIEQQDGKHAQQGTSNT